MADNDHALVIGVRDYPLIEAARGPVLQGPVEDAKAFGEWLIGPGKVPVDNVHLIEGVSTNTRAPYPVADQIDDAFGAIFSSIAAAPPRRLYVYFAGHGCSHHARHVLLLMANAETLNIGRGLNAQKYHERLEFLALFPEQLFFYDCCRNFDRTVPTGHEPSWPLQNPGPFAGQVCQRILYGAQFTQYAGEKRMIYSTKRGLFTRALLDGLNGGGAMPNGVVTTTSLMPFLKARLNQLAKREGLAQNVSRESIGLDDDLILAEDVTPWKTKVTALGPEGSTEVKVMDSKLNQVGTFSFVNSKAAFELMPGLYNLTAQPSGISQSIEVPPEDPITVHLRGP